MKLFKAKKGIHIPGKKDDTSKLSSVEFLSPEYVYIPLSVKGTDFDVLVKPGDMVKLGQKIAQRSKEKGLPLVKHASVSGEVVSIKERKVHSTGLPYVCIQIKNDFKDTPVEFTPVSNINKLDNTKLLEIIKEAGIVGLGGAGFPTYLKYENVKDIDTVILNGAECEPYITADYRIMIEETDRIIDGLVILMKLAKAEKGIITIKKGKTEVFKLLVESASKFNNITALEVPDEYPAGWERQVVYRTLKRSYKNFPYECGVIVNNVSTAVAVSKVVRDGLPLIERIVTVAGEGIIRPRNYLVRVGTLSTDLIKLSDGLASDMGDLRIIAGGPMMGVSLKAEEFVITSKLSGILALPGERKYVAPHNQSVRDVILDVLHFTKHDDCFFVRDEQPCVRCGNCVKNCPAGLQPTLIRTASLAKDEVLLDKLDVSKCISCGTCSYVCPSHIQVSEAIKKGKAYYVAKNRTRK